MFILARKQDCFKKKHSSNFFFTIVLFWKFVFFKSILHAYNRLLFQQRAPNLTNNMSGKERQIQVLILLGRRLILRNFFLGEHDLHFILRCISAFVSFIFLWFKYAKSMLLTQPLVLFLSMKTRGSLILRRYKSLLRTTPSLFLSQFTHGKRRDTQRR